MSEHKLRIHLPGLNGLRGIAALSVVISHTNLLPGISDFGLPPLFGFSIPLGAYAVTLFFVISGFLITYLLIKESDTINSINIPKFYIRRILRIWPIYYLFLMISIIILYIYGQQSDIIGKSLLFYIFFSANIPFIIKHGGIGLIFHYWSIGVEEQFYLFWPWIVKRYKSKLLLSTFILAVVFFFLKLLFWKIYGHESVLYKFFSVNRFDCMMIGAIGAILYSSSNSVFLSFFSNKGLQFLSWLLFVALSLNLFSLPLPIAHEVVSLGVLCIIVGQIKIKSRIINLEKNIFDFLGRISYGLYIIHPLVILILSKMFIHLEINRFVKYPLVYLSVIGVSVLISWLSYTYFESIFLRLKKTFAIVNSSSNMIS